MQTSNTTVYPSTKTGCGSEWAIDDRVTHLRDWATLRIRPLPLPPTRECWVGTGEKCEIRLEDLTRQVSRRHARLVREETTWTLYDNGSKIQQYAADAITELRPSSAVFPLVDCAWVRQHGRASLAEVEKATLRLVALRAARNLSQAAAVLGMAPVSLSRWIGRRETTRCGQHHVADRARTG